ncbi:MULTISPECIES: RAD55 family ATPase [Halorubrum]|uniref:KaiC-like transcriptional regulator n=1 Tax=Halorubrum hochstenium ATCC 700873 TaxID=1227481 RepID=M0F3J5_9EURY|nr:MULTISPECIES: circadian clock protein KaiC [Halorubrum]ELZ53757.1 KaiC-like transcriptional regulator [Halorubrum hochstenium ATCC 700873]
MVTLPTGISVLDRQFGGGLPSGSVVVLKANPDSQSELILNRFARIRRCRYLTTVRSAGAVEAALSPDGVEETTVEAPNDARDLDEAASLTEDLPENGTLIVDSVEPLEAETAPSAYAEFLDGVRSRVDDADGVALLHALRGGEDPRTRRVTEQIADVVFDLRTTVTGTEIANRLVVSKFRGGAALEEPLKLKLTDEVAVDTSRDIA